MSVETSGCPGSGQSPASLSVRRGVAAIGAEAGAFPTAEVERVVRPRFFFLESPYPYP